MKIRTIQSRLHILCLLTAFSRAVLQTVSAQESATAAEAAAPPPPVTAGEKVDQFFNGKLPDAISRGKFNLNVRLRYERADSDATKESNALTIRPRFGFTTAPVYGFQGMLEGEHISAIGNPDNYNQAGLNPGGAGRAVVADPTTTELNQAWISYANDKLATSLTGGRQRVVLDKARFVGDVVWRQNQQTLDAVSFRNKSVEDLSIYYGYVWNVNRVFGDRHPAGDFDSDSHLINASYSGWKYGAFTGYAYLLDFDNAAAASSATFGGSLVGGYTYNKETNTKVNYRAEYARQMDYGNQPIAGGYDADYYHLSLGGDYRRFNFGGGYEVLGSDGGRIGFSTPLATLHGFNGWADLFLGTPAVGLRDAYGWMGVKLPYDIPLKVLYHHFEADTGGANLGHEWDAVLTKSLGKYWSVLIKYAAYSGTGARADTQKFWAEINFKF